MWFVWCFLQGGQLKYISIGGGATLLQPWIIMELEECGNSCRDSVEVVHFLFKLKQAWPTFLKSRDCTCGVMLLTFGQYGVFW